MCHTPMSMSHLCRTNVALFGGYTPKCPEIRKVTEKVSGNNKTSFFSNTNLSDWLNLTETPFLK